MELRLHWVTLLGLCVGTVCSGCRTKGAIEPRPSDTGTTAPLPRLSRPISRKEITALPMGISFADVLARLGDPSLVGSVPALIYDAQEGGMYYLVFWRESIREPTGLQAVVHIPGSGQAVFVLPLEKRGQPSRILEGTAEEPRREGGESAAPGEMK